MGKINRLDEHLSNMIAAGEVVERPMGIVKELVENSIDANATQIEIQITQGGIERIVIIDNGSGMDSDDALLAFERHATSKLKEINDLWNINTMGFRGEALPSIASVSHVLMRTNNSVESTEVNIQYGTLVHAMPCGTPQGTMIQIENLFQKTPARFKHLKSPQYEFSLISDLVQKFALSHPDIAFMLSHDGRTVCKTNGNGNLLEVLMQIYGREAVKSAMHISTSDQDYKIEGYAIQPSFNRATKYYILLYINGRMIRNYRLQKAVIDAYRDYMPKDRYPIVVLDIIMDAQLVDVNVHPSKWEIRLSKEKQLEKLLYTSLQDALKEKHQVNEVKINSDKKRVDLQSLTLTYKEDPTITKMKQEVNDSFKDIPASSSYQDNVDYDAIETEKASSIQEKQTVYSESNNDVEPVSEAKEDAISIDISDISQDNLQKYKQDEVIDTLKKVDTTQELIYEKEVNNFKAINQSLPQMDVIGQFHNCYIIAQGENGLYIIDQHAAQERYHFEQIQKGIMSDKVDMQPLLVPITIESTISAVIMIDELNELLTKIGIELEEFGNNAFICRQLPVWMKNTDEKAFLEDMIDYWLKDREIVLEKLRHHAVATMACHSSIRFNRSLNLEEMKQVIDDLGKCEQPFHCPHGRPTFICLSDKHLFKEFQRGG